MKAFLVLSSFAVCLLLAIQPAAAQKKTGGVKGIIIDSLNGERLSLVNVFVLDQGSGAATDANGFFFIGNLPAGKARIRATLIGYSTSIREVDIVAGKIIDLNFEMSPTVYQMETIETRADRRVRYDTEISTMPIGTTEIEIVPATGDSD